MARHALVAAAWPSLILCGACELASAPAIGPPDPTSPPFDVGIEGVHLTQAVQDHAGTVPLVQGRAGLLRVFLQAALPDVPAPQVRVRLVDSATGALIRTYTAASPLAVVPTSIVESARGGCWEVAVSGADVRPGTHVVAEIDPVPGIAAERFVSSFRHPPAGSLDVRAGHQLPVTIVPIVQSGLRPDVTTSRTAGSWLERARSLHPVGGFQVEVGSTYFTSTVLEADGGGWPALMAELDRKRVLEGTSRRYLGAVRVGYASGIAGRSDWCGKTAIAWDVASSYQRIVAHELGHNFCLLHAPCGADPSSVDPDWPSSPAYEGARIGVFGWDPLTGAIKDPARTWDHMGYCGDASTTWTSDYGYRRALAAIEQEQAAGMVAAPVREPSLFVSGRLRGGAVELDPAYDVDTVPQLPPPGPYAVDLLDGEGGRVASVPFAPTAVAPEAEGESAQAHFAIAIALPAASRDLVRGVAVREGDRELARRESLDRGGREVPVEVADTPRGTLVRWNHARRPEAMVRNRRTGEIVAFARGGAALVEDDAPNLELVLSDGVHSDRPMRARAR